MDKKRVRNLLAVLFLTFGTSLWFIPESHATPPELMVRNVTIICANPAGETHTATTGWDADNSYFNGCSCIVNTTNLFFLKEI